MDSDDVVLTRLPPFRPLQEPVKTLQFTSTSIPLCIAHAPVPAVDGIDLLIGFSSGEGERCIAPASHGAVRLTLSTPCDAVVPPVSGSQVPPAAPRRCALLSNCARCASDLLACAPRSARSDVCLPKGPPRRPSLDKADGCGKTPLASAETRHPPATNGNPSGIRQWALRPAVFGGARLAHPSPHATGIPAWQAEKRITQGVAETCHHPRTRAAGVSFSSRDASGASPKCTAVVWVPKSEGLLFLSAHSDGARGFQPGR